MSTQRLFARSLLAAVTVTGAACSSKQPAATDKAPEPTTTAPAAKAAADAEHKRRSLDCAGIIKSVVESVPEDAPVTATPGWGTLPAALQIVPPGGELCAMTDFGGDSWLVRSSLDGQALVDFYRPVATTAGCQVKHGIIGDRRKQTVVEIVCDGQAWALIGTDGAHEFYSVTMLTPRKAG